MNSPQHSPMFRRGNKCVDLLHGIVWYHYTTIPYGMHVSTNCISSKIVKFITKWFFVRFRNWRIHRFCLGFVIIMLLIERSPTPNTSDIFLRICLMHMVGWSIKIFLYILTIRGLTSELMIWNVYITKISLNNNFVLNVFFNWESSSYCVLKYLKLKKKNLVDKNW